MFNYNALAEIISNYKNNFNQIHEEEIYKWKAVKCFQDNWNENAADFPSMLDQALGKASNLLVSRNFYPKGMICGMAERDPEAVRAMFIALFDELQPVTERIEKFIENADELRLKYGGGSWNNHYQTFNSVSIYLFFRYPNKYYIYKYRKFKDFTSKVDYSLVPKMGNIKDIQNYFNMCNEILEVIKQDSELLTMNKNRLTKEDFPDNAFHILTDDIVFFGGMKVIKSGVWWPSEEEYHPGIDKNTWLKLLADKNIFTSDSKAIMKRLLDIGGEATCTQLSQKYGETKNFYNIGSSSLANRIYQETGCPVMTRNNENSRWWPILYIGKNVDKDVPGVFMWRLRPELIDALKKYDLADIPLYSKPQNDLNKQINYWWLNASPKIWSFSDKQIAEEQCYTLLNESGNKRRIYENFLAAKNGDLIIGYEATPVKQIVALCRITRENDGKNLYFEKVEGLSTPIEYSVIKDVPELQQMEFFVNPNGSLFKLTKDEYELLLEIIREQNPISEDEYNDYSKQDFLKDVYLSEGQYDSLVSLLEHKKNIILQGSPGVGKTFTAKRLAYSILGKEDDNRVKIVQFHQNYSYEDFIMGYKPDGTGFKLQTGIFYEFCRQAENNPDDKFFFIIDEINRGNLSKIFGELLMTIEKDYRSKRITMAYNGLQFSVPENLYIIGMMNTADRSLAIIDYALRRRFSFFDMSPAFNSDGFKSYQQFLSNEAFDDLIELIKELNRDIETDASLGKGFCIGHSYFCGHEIYTEDWLSEIIEYDLIPMLNEYWFDDEAKSQMWAKKLRGVLHD
jgi:5-methylcytosine-specific restriction protein B